MELWLAWVVVGFVLVTVELATGTFYLLVLGVGAFAGAAAAYFGANVLVQAVVASVIAVAGVFAVHHWGSRNKSGSANDSNFLDRGQPAVLESWVDEKTGLVRVRYRGTSWNAKVVGGGPAPAMGATLYIEGQDGQTLRVASTPPAA